MKDMLDLSMPTGRQLISLTSINYKMMKCFIFKPSLELRIWMDLFNNIQIPNPDEWEISIMEKMKCMLCVDVCFKELDAFIDMMHNYIHCLHWMLTNKLEYPKCNNNDEKDFTN